MASYLGIDAGTQSLKAIVIGEDAVLAESAVHFGRDLPRYGAPNGFLPGDDPAVRHADPRMWTEALELALQRLADAGANLADVRGISGSGQQARRRSPPSALHTIPAPTSTSSTGHRRQMLKSTRSRL